MGVICDILTSRTARRSTTTHPAQWFIDWIHGGGTSSAGVTVSNDSALKYTPFWAAIRVISGTLAALPFLVYRRLDDGGKKREQGHPIYKLLHDRPNEYMDSVTFIETRQAQALCYGNGYAEIQRDGRGRPVALWPLLPNRTERKIDDRGVPYYEVTMPTGEKIRLSDNNVLHVKGLGFDGYTGYNVVSYQKEALGYGVAVKEYGARFFSSDGYPGGVLEHPTKLGDTALKHLKESWQARHGGLSNKHRLQILEEGMKWSKTGVDPEQAQALEVQKYTVDDCARIFNIPPHKLASMEHATFSNIEEQNLDFLSSTMLYWFRKWEQECNYKLFMPSEQSNLFCEILVDGLLRGSAEARSKLYASGRQWGYYSINDIRRMENMNPIGPDGDNYLDPLNMKPAGAADPPSPTSPSSSQGEDARQVLRDIIVDQFRRVAIKLSRTGHKREKERTWASKLLTDPVRAYTILAGQPQSSANTVLERALSEFIQPDVTLDESRADQFATRITKLLGAPNGQRKAN